jgi:hypothetical protein
MNSKMEYAKTPIPKSFQALPGVSDTPVACAIWVPITPKPKNRPILVEFGLTVGADPLRDGSEWFDDGGVDAGVPMTPPVEIGEVIRVNFAGKEAPCRVIGLDALRPLYADHAEADHAREAGFSGFADFLHGWVSTGERLDSWAWVISFERVTPARASKGAA